MRSRRTRAFALVATLLLLVGGAVIPSSASAGAAEDAALQTALRSAAESGFVREFSGDDQVFDGSRQVPVTGAGVERLRDSQAGTLIVRFMTSQTTNQVVVAGGSGTASGAYGAILANGSAGTNKVRVDFPNGMVANLNGPAATGGWRTVAYSVDASPGGTSARTTVSIDGSTSTQYPNFASWFNANSTINALSFLTIGGAPGALASSSNSANFNGRIAFVAFVPTKYTQTQAAAITAPAVSGPSFDQAQVFYRGDGTGSSFFRIPFVLNTTSGSLIAGTDANMATTGDSADNIDAALRRKPAASGQAAGQGWSPASIPFALHMQDYADEVGYKQESASVIDGAIVQDTASGRITMLIDLFAWNGGFFEQLNVDSEGGVAGGRTRSFVYGDGFATLQGRKFLLLSTQNIKGNADGKTGNINQNTDRSRFDLVADVGGPKDAAGRTVIYSLIGTPRPYSATNIGVDDSNLSLGAATTYSIDANFVLYDAGQQLSVTQRTNAGPGPLVPMKVFYKDSPLQIYNTSHILKLSSVDDGQTWVSDGLITGMVKRENSRYYLLGPGRGLQLTQGPHAGRLLVPVYYQGGPSTEVIYSDDAGTTWAHGEAVPTSLAQHEATMVELPGGGVQIFLRNTSSSGGAVVMATSVDGGVTWRDIRSALGDNNQGINSQVSSISLKDPVVSPTTGAALPAFVMTTAMSRGRVNGVAHVGLFHPDGTYADGAVKHRIEWIKQHQITGPNERFAYSSMDQLANGSVALLFETSPSNSWTEGLKAMYLRQIPLADLLP